MWSEKQQYLVIKMTRSFGGEFSTTGTSKVEDCILRKCQLFSSFLAIYLNKYTKKCFRITKCFGWV